MNEPAQHAQQGAVRPGPARAKSVTSSRASAARLTPCDTDARRAASLRSAFGYRSGGAWTLDAIASLLGVRRQRVSEWMRDGSHPAWVVSALPVAERAAYLAALDDVQIGRAA